MKIKNHFHFNGFEMRLSLKQRLGMTQKWPFSQESKTLKDSGHSSKIESLYKWSFNNNIDKVTFLH